jgi:hypothetical protein
MQHTAEQENNGQVPAIKYDRFFHSLGYTKKCFLIARMIVQVNKSANATIIPIEFLSLLHIKH